MEAAWVALSRVGTPTTDYRTLQSYEWDHSDGDGPPSWITNALTEQLRPAIAALAQRTETAE